MLHIKRRMAKNVMILFVVAPFFFILIGCPSVKLFQPNLADNSEELGSVHITLLPPLLYEEYKSKLQPEFKMTAEKALEEALPVTMKSTSFEGRVSRLAAEVSLPTESFDDEKVTTTTNGVESTTKTEKVFDKSGAVPELESEPGSLSNKSLPINNEKLGVDPLLKYWTATAIYQEIQLINNYFKGMSLDEDYIPYIVRLQITTLPKKRNAPYDTFVDVNFSGLSKIGSVDSYVKEEHDQLPVIFPMLVTDSLESKENQLSIEQVKELALALKGMVNGIGFGTRISDYHQILKSALGREYNSLLTVARIGDNTLRVRIGAMQQPGSAYAIIPRNYNISLIAMVPAHLWEANDLHSMHLNGASVTQFFNANDGQPLRSMYDINPELSRTDLAKNILVEAGFVDLSSQEINKILEVVFTGEITKFKPALYGDKAKVSPIVDANIVLMDFLKKQDVSIKSVISTDIGPSNVEKVESDLLSMQLSHLWLKLIRTGSDSSLDFTSVRLPSPMLKPLCINVSADTDSCKESAKWIQLSDKLSALDDGKQVKVTLAPVGNVRDTKVFARLYATTKKNTEVSFPSKGFSSNSNANQLTISFDSLVGWGINSLKELKLYDFPNNKSHLEYVFPMPKYEIKEGIGALGIKMVNKNGNDYIAVKSGGTESTVIVQLVGAIDVENYSQLVVEKARFDGDSAGLIADTVDKTQKVTAENVIQKTGKTLLKLSNLVHDEKIIIYGVAKDGRETNKLVYTVKVAAGA